MVRDWLLILIVTLAGLSTIEIALSASFPGDRLGRRPLPGRLVPNRTETFARSAANGGATIEWSTNRWGFRGPDIDLVTDLPRIMIYGDSNVLARFSELESTFVYQLGQQLERRTGRRYQVINAGKVGFGPDEIAIRISEDIDAWRPDLVVVNLFADNDFGDLFRNNLCRLGADASLHFVTEQASVTARIGMFLESLSIYRVSAIISNAVFGQSELVRRTNRLPGETELDYLRRRVDEEYQNYVNNIRTGGPDHYDLDTALSPSASSSALKRQLMAAVLANIRDRVTASGADLLFLIQPSSKDVSTNIPLNYTILEKLSPSYHRRNLTDALAHILQKLDVGYINLFDKLVTDGRSDYYFVLDDNHWNDLGQRFAAGIVADYIATSFAVATTGDPGPH